MKQTFGDTPFMKGVPEGAKNKLMHIQLPITETVHLMGSDAVEGFGPPLKRGPARSQLQVSDSTRPIDATDQGSEPDPLSFR